MIGEYSNYWFIYSRDNIDFRKCVTIKTKMDLKRNFNIFKIGSRALDEMKECHSDYVFCEIDVKRLELTDRVIEFKELKRLHNINQL